MAQDTSTTSSISRTRTSPRPAPTPTWLRRTLVLAGIYNLLWGGWVVLFPGSLFALAGLEPPVYPAIWQCVGMIVGVYGIGYLIASRDPVRHWPIVLVGLLGKVLGPIGFVYAALITDQLPGAFIWTIIPNDLIWWVPFSMLLIHSARTLQGGGHDTAQSMGINAALRAHHDQHATPLSVLSDESPVMLVFLRHLGCTFCLETLQDLRAQRERIESRGVRPVIVHMSDDQSAEALFERYGLGDLSRVSDPEQALYRAFELRRAGVIDLFGPRVWGQGLRAVLRGNGVGRLRGDGFQMPGVFIVHRGRVVEGYRHKAAGDRPGYQQMAAACSLPAPAAS